MNINQDDKMTYINYSFIIPHHNTPILLLRLINSIPQRDDIEIIVVDDNSDPNLKPKVSRPDVRIIFIDKEQTKGAGRARNIGMKAARGKWFLFADADDLYKSGFIDVLDEYKDTDIETLFFNIDSADSQTLMADKTHRSSVQQRLIRQYSGTKESSDNLLYFAYGPWRKMINSSFVKKYGFEYEEIPKGNDQMFSLMTSYFTNKWMVDKRILYTLTYNSKSLTFGNLDKNKCLSDLNILKRRAQFFIYIGHPEWNWNCARGHLFQSCLFFCYKTFKKSPRRGLLYLFYYITNWRIIKSGANYYVDVAEKLSYTKGT